MPFSVRISYHGSGGPQRETVRTVSRFSRVTIGRASDCDIVLDDPQRHVSRVHAVITPRDGDYVLSVISKVNYVLVNARQFAPNSSTTVRTGDRIEVGEYCLEVLSGAPDAASHAQTVKMDPRLQSVLRPGDAQASAPSAPRAAAHRGKGLIASFADEAPIVSTPAAEAKIAAGARQAVAQKADPELLRAFMEGAGIAGLQPPADADRFIRDGGALLRAAVEGIIALLMARGEMKKEMRAEDRTMVAARDNNPLKLMTDVQEVLGYLVDPQAPDGAFLPPVRAVQDACEDLRSHELALMAAMRAAIMGAIERFDPARLEEAMVKTRSGITLNRKAHLWDLFVGYQARLARETEDDFNQVFAKEFLGTYTAQVKRLRAKR